MSVVIRGDQEAIGQSHLNIDEPSQTQVWGPRVTRMDKILALETQARQDAKTVAANLAAQLTIDYCVEANGTDIWEPTQLFVRPGNQAELQQESAA
jgi:hypothetical protein